ncbi:hypothetical protein HGRIS_011436 [Hohenbuehelia grisea]|uniref:Uncharacterized protein n=1 Tax=Hohenbuehelia grisea TaxID=104357 RepID=A0ABR3JWF5_9AGAR
MTAWGASQSCTRRQANSSALPLALLGSPQAHPVWVLRSKKQILLNQAEQREGMTRSESARSDGHGVQQDMTNTQAGYAPLSCDLVSCARNALPLHGFFRPSHLTQTVSRVGKLIKPSTGRLDNNWKCHPRTWRPGIRIRTWLTWSVATARAAVILRRELLAGMQWRVGF